MRVDPDNSLMAYIDYLRSNRGEVICKIICAQSNDEFDEGLESLLEKAVDYLEQNANHLCHLGEEAISCFLVAFLHIPGVLRAIQEAHSNGHVDITIEDVTVSPRRRLAEAKIYKGPAYHTDGLSQLIDRYMTGRIGKGFIIEYFKEADISGLVAKMRSHLDQEKPCKQQGDSQIHLIRWAFTTVNLHHSGESLHILHLNCNLHRPMAEGSGSASTDKPKTRRRR